MLALAKDYTFAVIQRKEWEYDTHRQHGNTRTGAAQRSSWNEATFTNIYISVRSRRQYPQHQQSAESNLETRELSHVGDSHRQYTNTIAQHNVVSRPNSRELGVYTKVSRQVTYRCNTLFKARVVRG